MKKLSRKHKIALVELVVILAVAVYFFFPRPLSGALGSGFDPDEVTGVQVDLTAFGGEAEGGRTLSLSPDDPAWEELLSLLSSKWYRPYYLEGSSRNVTLDYTVQITISQPEAVFRYSLTGDKAIDLAAGAEGTRGRSFQVTDSQAFQQSVLDFLLEQEYTEQDARQEGGVASPAGKGAACGAPNGREYQKSVLGAAPLWARSSAGQGASRYKLHDIGVNEPWTIYNISAAPTTAAPLPPPTWARRSRSAAGYSVSGTWAA